MGTNQQLTTEQLELLKFLYNVKIERKYNENVMTSNNEIIRDYICAEAEIQSREKVSTVKKCLIRIAQIFTNKKDVKENECRKKEEYIARRLRKKEELEDGWNNLKQRGFVDEKGKLTTEGTQIVLIALDDEEKEKDAKSEKKKERWLDVISAILGR